MSLRVISGKARGRRLRDVPGGGTRPITDRVKEALFNIIGGDVVGSTWLDLFAGTGAVGIEALSRGADRARLLDLDKKAVAVIRQNLSECRLGDQAEARQGNAFQLLAAPADMSFDYIYIAPPQYRQLWLQALQALDENPGWLAPDGWVVVQIHPLEYQPQVLSALEEFDQRKYGSTLLVFFQKPGQVK